MKENSSFRKAFGIGQAIANSKNNKKNIETAKRSNKANRGLITCSPCQIEAYFSCNEPIGNYILSGSNFNLRNRLIPRICQLSMQQGYVPLILHCQNNALEQQILSAFGSNGAFLLNSSGKLYDPFISLANGEIDRLIFESASKTTEIKPAGKYYIDGISDYIRACNKNPAAYMYIGCPHTQLIDQINNSAMIGTITQPEKQAIISQLLQGESERGSIENYFSLFGRQSSSVLAGKGNIARAMSIRQAILHGYVTMVDILSESNQMLLNMIIAEIKESLAVGTRLLLVVDNIQIAMSEKLKELMRINGSSCVTTVSADDAYALMGGNDSDFFAFAGKSSKMFIFHHSSAYSAQKWVDIIGSYDKLDFSNTSSNYANYYERLGFGSTNTTSIVQKRESIIKSEEICRMGQQNAIVLSRDSHEIIWAQIV